MTQNVGDVIVDVFLVNRFEFLYWPEKLHYRLLLY